MLLKHKLDIRVKRFDKYFTNQLYIIERNGKNYEKKIGNFLQLSAWIFACGVWYDNNTRNHYARPANDTVNTQNTPAEPKPSESGTSKTSEENYTVYLITMDLTDSYWKSIDDGCLDAVADGANAILIAANSAEGVNESLEKAANAGCKIVYVDSAATYECVTALSTDNQAAGKTAGETMKKALQDKGITSGTIGIMGVTIDTASCVAREQGFREAFEGTPFVLSDTVYMQDNAENVKSAVAEGVSQNYVGFFGTNEGTTAAIGTALQESGEDLVAVGFDTSDTVLGMVAEGVIYATMKQNPDVMGRDGMNIAVGALEGTITETNTKTDTGVTVITKDSM